MLWRQCGDGGLVVLYHTTQAHKVAPGAGMIIEDSICDDWNAIITPPN